MQEIKRQELEELKKFLVDNGWVDGLFQILFLLGGAKPGVYLQKERKRRKLKLLRNMLSWFGLYVSMKHGGYATKSEDLYKEWNKTFGFKLDAEKFLGYPNCCVEIHKSGFGSTIIGINLYSLIKEMKYGRKTRQDLQQFLINLKFLHHWPCKSSCKESILLERRFELVIKKYLWLVKELLLNYNKRKIEALIQILELLPTSSNLLKDRGLLSQLELNPDDVKEILENEKDFKDNISYGKRMLISFL